MGAEDYEMRINLLYRMPSGNEKETIARQKEKRKKIYPFSHVSEITQNRRSSECPWY